jgi:hypothetical protein
VKFQLFLIFLVSTLIVSCSSNQSGSPFGDYKASTCTGDNCDGKTPTPEPSFERDDNSDVIVGKFDNTVEVSGKCRLNGLPDSEIQIQVTAEGATPRTLADGYVPIVGVTSANGRVAKCEKGRWAIAINACNNLMGNAGVHRLDLTLKAKDKSGKITDIQDGKLTMNLIRSIACDVSVQ